MKKYLEQNPFVFIATAFVAFCFSIILFRVYYTGQLSFLFLVWNLFLAGLPWVFIQMAKYVSKQKPFSLTALILGGFSLLFLPNSPYIITDLFHLHWHQQPHFIWFDTILIFTYAMTGLMFFYATILDMENLLLRYLTKPLTAVILFFILFLNGFGIYLGRFLRFNSWDILSNPMGLIGEILDRITNPVLHPLTWGVTLLYGALFLLGYLCIKAGKWAVIQSAKEKVSKQK